MRFSRKNKADKQKTNSSRDFYVSERHQLTMPKKFRQFWRDIQTLDMQNYGSWSLPIKSMVHALIIAIILALIWMFPISSKKDEIKIAEARKAVLLDTYKQKAFQTRYLNEYNKQLTMLDASNQRLQMQLPDRHQPSLSSNLIDQISQLSVSSNVEIMDIAIGQAIEQKNYIEEPIKIEVIGDYNDLGSFLSQLVNMTRIVTVHDFSLTPNQNKTSAQEKPLQLSLQLNAYQARVDVKDNIDASVQDANDQPMVNSSNSHGASQNEK